jgi:hypothetical protein
MPFPTTLKEGWHAFLDLVDHLKHPEDDYMTFDSLEDIISDPKTSPQERLRWQTLQICLYGDVSPEDVPNGDVKYGSKYVRYEECKHFRENVGAQACVEMKNASARFPGGRTTLVVEKPKGRCEPCEKRERKREWIERLRYWRGLV